jgi:hypothetical protein
MNTSDEIAAAFERVDQFLLAAGEVAPSVELLLARARQQGVSETAMLRHLRLNSTTARWVMKLAADATTDRSIDLDAGGPGRAGAQVGEIVRLDKH